MIANNHEFAHGEFFGSAPPLRSLLEVVQVSARPSLPVIIAYLLEQLVTRKPIFRYVR